MYIKIHVPSMLAKGVETINKQTQQNKQPQWLRKFIKHSHMYAYVLCTYVHICVCTYVRRYMYVYVLIMYVCT